MTCAGPFGRSSWRTALRPPYLPPARRAGASSGRPITPIVIQPLPPPPTSQPSKTVRPPPSLLSGRRRRAVRPRCADDRATVRIPSARPFGHRLWKTVMMPMMIWECRRGTSRPSLRTMPPPFREPSGIVARRCAGRLSRPSHQPQSRLFGRRTLLAFRDPSGVGRAPIDRSAD